MGADPLINGFSSANAMENGPLYPKDDMLSLAYLLVFLASGNLDCFKSGSNNITQVINNKKMKTPKEVTKNCKNLTEFVEEVYAIEDTSLKVDYRKFKFELEKVILNKNRAPDGKFDWSHYPE